METSEAGAAFKGCVLQQILNGQGAAAVKQALQAFGPQGDKLREHALSCDDCQRLVYQLFRGRPMAINHDPLSDEILAYIQQLE